jgi:MFS transporter, PPP family, 3-phenylpropionic acid transporter
MSLRLRTSLYYFSQFWSGGAFHAYGGIWFASLGFSATQIGLANTIPTTIVLLSNIFVGRLADRAKDWRQVLIVLALMSTLATVGLIFAKGFYPVFFFWSLALIMQTFAVPIGDGAATYLARDGRGSIGTMRALSTIGYILSLFATGYVIQGFGGGVFAALFASCTAFRALSALVLPPFKTLGEAQKNESQHLGLRQFAQPWLLLPLLGWAVVYATIQVLNSFFALILKKQGIAEGTIGWIIAWGAIAEAIVFFSFSRFSHLLSLRTWIIISCAATVLRWVAMANQPDITIIFLLQTFHGVSYALGFVACVTYIAKRTSPSMAAETQSTFNVMQMVSAVLVVTAFGGLMERYGAQAFYGSAVVALLGTVLALAALRFTPPEPTVPDQSGPRPQRA